MNTESADRELGCDSSDKAICWHNVISIFHFTFAFPSPIIKKELLQNI